MSTDRTQRPDSPGSRTVCSPSRMPKHIPVGCFPGHHVPERSDFMLFFSFGDLLVRIRRGRPSIGIRTSGRRRREAPATTRASSGPAGPRNNCVCKRLKRVTLSFMMPPYGPFRGANAKCRQTVRRSLPSGICRGPWDPPSPRYRLRSTRARRHRPTTRSWCRDGASTCSSSSAAARSATCTWPSRSRKAASDGRWSSSS